MKSDEYRRSRRSLVVDVKLYPLTKPVLNSFSSQGRKAWANRGERAHVFGLPQLTLLVAQVARFIGTSHP